MLQNGRINMWSLGWLGLPVFVFVAGQNFFDWVEARNVEIRLSVPAQLWLPDGRGVQNLYFWGASLLFLWFACIRSIAYCAH